MATPFSLVDYLVSGQPETYISGLNSTITDRLYALYNAAPPEVRSNLQILSGARSTERQQQLWDEALKKYGSAEKARKWVAPPGKSQHNHGNAVDFKFGNAAAKKWVHENAGTYGLHFRMSNEPWHVEPIPNWKGSVPPIPKVNIGAANVLPANLTRGIDQKRMAYAAQMAPPRPATMSAAMQQARQGTVPSLASKHAFDSPRTPQQVASLYEGIYPAKAPVPGLRLPQLPSTQAAAPRPATMSPALAAARQRLSAAREAKASGGVLPVGPFPTKPGVNTGVLDVAEIKPMSQSGPQARKTIFDTGFGSLLGKSVSPSTQNPKAPVSVRVPTGPTMDPRGSGTSYAAVQKFTSPRSPTSRPTLMDSVGRGATLADLSSFNGRSGAFRTGQGIAGTVQLPANVTPQIPAIIPPKAAVFTPKAAALPPPTQTINPAMRNALSAVAPGTPMKVPPIPATRPAALPPPSSQPAPNPITVARPRPVTFQGSSSGNTYQAGQLYQSGGYVYQATPQGTFTKVGKVGQSISTSGLPRPGLSSGASLGAGTTVSRGYTPSQSLGAS